MSIIDRATHAVAIFVSAAVLIGALPAGNAFGATAVPEIAMRVPLAAPQVDLEADYPAMVLPTPDNNNDADPAAAPVSLAALVRTHGAGDARESELNCLATAVYFESKGEPLTGQLAVARVIMNRAQSGRFASTLCGVIRQPSQFSFVRRGTMPTAANNVQWRAAVGVAHVAMNDLYKSAAPDALYFHARRVSPAWGKRPVASIGNHIFYR
jgi:N-acetylmuramoyl-L-alanine amidase